jgi:hypothetical protein
MEYFKDHLVYCCLTLDDLKFVTLFSVRTCFYFIMQLLAFEIFDPYFK